MTKEDLIKYKQKLAKLSEKEEKLRNIYLSKLASGEIQGPNTGYPSIDKPWLKNYNAEEIQMDIPKKTMYEMLLENNKNNLKETALIYFDKKITYKELIENIEKCAQSLKKIGVKKNEIVTICMPSTPETI